MQKKLVSMSTFVNETLSSIDSIPNCLYDLEGRQIKHFTQDELQKVSCSPMHIDKVSLARLDLAREIAGIPFILNSAYRSVKHEISKGRSGNSAHTLGKGFDIRCFNSATRFRIVSALLLAGFPRIGIADTFIHCDDSNLTGPVIWTY